MRCNGFHYSVNVYLRMGEFTVFSGGNALKYGKLNHASPGLLGQAVHEYAIPFSGFYPVWPAGTSPEAKHRVVGAPDEQDLSQTTGYVLIISDGNEARFSYRAPCRNNHHDFYPRPVSTSPSPVFPLFEKERTGDADDPLFIAPWWDPEMLGQVVLSLFRAMGPPIGKGLTSIFSPPELAKPTVFQRAARTGRAALLPRRSRYSVDGVDAEGVTALMTAAGYGHPEVMLRLLEKGADPRLQDNRGRSALHHAAEGGHAEAVTALAELGLAVELPDAAGSTALHLAAGRGHAAAVTRLLAAGADARTIDPGFSSTPLHLAARGGHASLVPLLVDGGAEVDARDEHSRTPLHVAAGCGQTDTAAALLRSGAAADSRDRRGATPLHQAAFYPHFDCMAYLIGRGADAGAKDEDGDTPLHVAAAMNRDRTARLLLEAGADAGTVNNEGLTPLDLAIVNVHTPAHPSEFPPWPTRAHARMREHNSEVAQVLLEAGALLDPLRLPIGDRHLLWPHLTPSGLLHESGGLDYALLGDYAQVHRGHLNPKRIGSRAYPAEPLNAASFTILHDAAVKNLPSLVRRLLDGGVSPVTACWNWTPLHVAAVRGNVEIARLLLECGADLETPVIQRRNDEYDMDSYRRGWGGSTPLDTAISGGQTDMARFLLEQGAAPPPDPHVALTECCPKDQQDPMARLFRDFGLV